jgi:hypothetical protein
MEKQQKPWIYIILGALSIIFVAWVIYFIYYNIDMQEKIAYEKKKMSKWSDSLRITQTELGAVYERHAKEVKLKDGIIAQLEYQLSISQNFQTQESVIVNETEDSLFAYHTNTYSDSGMVLSLKDSIWFWKQEKWYSLKSTEFNLELFLDQEVGRDETGNFFGRVISKSKHIKIMGLNTKFSDLYNPPPPDEPEFIYARNFGISTDVDIRAVAAGIVFGIKQHQLGAKYVIFSKDFPDNLPWYEKLRFQYTFYLF